MAEKSPAKESAETSKLNLYGKLAKIGANVRVLKKDKSGFNYTYVAEEDILARIQGTMQELSVSLIPRIVPDSVEYLPRDTTKTIVLKTGERVENMIYEQVVKGYMTFTWIDNENPNDKVEVPWFFIGQQSDASQAYGSALTYASRYFLLRFFNIATTNDPDALRAKQKEEDAKRDKEVTAEILAEISKIVNDEIAKDEKNRTRLATMIENIIGTKDYRKVKNSTEAAMLLEELTKSLSKTGGSK